MSAIDDLPQDFVSAFALQRQRLLRHAGAILALEPAAEPVDVKRLSQTVLTSLELLKVAEEELREERRTNATIQGAQEKQMGHLTAMFALAPTALVLTTGDTTIREANAAAAHLFGRDAYSCTGRQMWDMVLRDERPQFREQLGRAIEMGGVPSWSFTLQVQRSAPLTVRAILKVIDDPAVGARALYWNLVPMAPPQTVSG